MSDYSPDPEGDTYYIDSNGGVHSTPQECIESNLQIESANGQYVTGGNCGQDPDNVPDDGK